MIVPKLELRGLGADVRVQRIDGVKQSGKFVLRRYFSSAVNRFQLIIGKTADHSGRQYPPVLKWLLNAEQVFGFFQRNYRS